MRGMGCETAQGFTRETIGKTLVLLRFMILLTLWVSHGAAITALHDSLN